MNRRGQVWVSLLLMITLGLSTAGCSALVSSFKGQAESATSQMLLAVVAKSAQQEMDTMRTENPGVFSVAAVKTEPPGTLVLTMRFKDQLPKKTVKQVMGSEKTLRKQMQPLLEQLSEGGIKDPEIRWVVLNADGTQISKLSIKG